MNLICSQLNNSPYRTYFLRDASSKEVVLIDPIMNFHKKYLSLINRNNYKLKCIIDTHTHEDRISAGSYLTELFGCTYIMHKNSLIEAVTLRVDDNTQITLAENLDVNFIFCPGHSNDSLALIAGDNLFIGDFIPIDNKLVFNEFFGTSISEYYLSAKKIKELNPAYKVFSAFNPQESEIITLNDLIETHWIFNSNTYYQFFKNTQPENKNESKWKLDVFKANQLSIKEYQNIYIPEERLNFNFNFKFISSSILYSRLMSENPPILLDIRSPYELREQPLSKYKSVKIPFNELLYRKSEISNLKSNEITILCKNGSKACIASKLLRLEGFEYLNVLSGGVHSSYSFLL